MSSYSTRPVPSGLDMIDVLTCPKQVTAPAELWRNWWRVRLTCLVTGKPPVGHVYPDMDMWPSREICEEKAREEIEWDIRDAGEIVDEWLGAFPAEEAP